MGGLRYFYRNHGGSIRPCISYTTSHSPEPGVLWDPFKRIFPRRTISNTKKTGPVLQDVLCLVGLLLPSSNCQALCRPGRGWSSSAKVFLGVPILYKGFLKGETIPFQGLCFKGVLSCPILLKGSLSLFKGLF